MPIFEFRCSSCGKRYSTLVGMTADSGDIKCPYCGSPQSKKLVSRVGKFRSEDGRIDEIAGEIEHYGEPDSTSDMRKMVREMGKAMDEDMADEMEEMFEADMEGTPGDDF